MNKDFYLEQRGLASYFEKEWFDHYLKQAEIVDFEFAKFDPRELYCEFNEKVAHILLSLCREKNLYPERYLEIGPGLGRSFYEMGKASLSIKEATLVEPSENLAQSLERIFLIGQQHRFPILKGNGEISEVLFDSSRMSLECSHISKTIIQKTFEEAKHELLPSNLVVCLNVLDQCQHPFKLLDLIKGKTVQGGILATSCTFQWQKKYLGSDSTPFSDLRTQFTEGWEILAEVNEPFHVKLNERCWYTFLPQVLILHKL